MPAPGGDRATLSRDLADFLIELSIALHKHAMYPEGHPSLAPAAAGETRHAGLLRLDRATLALGVARQQLVIEGVATDPKPPVLAELAARLHRHHLGAGTFRRGVEPGEMASVLKTLAVEAERTGQPLGLGPPEQLRAWTCVQLHPLTYERLELVDDGAPASERGARGAQLWVGLARAALTAEAGDDHPPATEPAVIARAIDEHPRTDAAAYDQVIVGYLLQIADELKTAGSTEAVALRRRTSRLIRALKPDTLRRLVEMGGDFVQRRQFVYDSTDGMAVDAVLEILQAAADSSHQTISHSLIRMLSKLAAHAEAGAATVRPQAEAALRDQVRQLLQGWTLQDPNPGQYGAALARMARAAPERGATADGEHPTEPDRIVAMALEIDAVNPQVLAAADRVVREGRLGQLLDALAEVPESMGAAPEVWARLATPDVVRQLATREPVDFKTLERLVPRGGLPAGFSAATYLRHADARVRWQAVKVQVKLPAERDAALALGLQDPDPRTLRLALGLAVALQSCPDAAVPTLAGRALDRALPPDVRTLAVRALGYARAPAALEVLLRLTSGGRTLFGREKLAPKSAELLGALAGLASGWQRDPRARAVLRRAAASGDPDIGAAADTGERGSAS